jgi:hypothetical protein
VATIANNQNAVLANLIYNNFIIDAKRWVAEAQSTVQTPGYLSEIIIKSHFMKWIEPIVTVDEERDSNGKVTRTLIRTVDRRASRSVNNLRLPRESGIENYGFEEAASTLAEWILNSGNSPFGLRYRIEGSIVQGIAPSSFSQTIKRLGNNKTAEEIDTALTQFIETSSGGAVEVDSDTDSDDPADEL